MDVTMVHDRVPLDHDVLMRVAEAVFGGEKSAPLDVSLVVVDDAESRRVNVEHLGHDWVTDVIAFDLRDETVDERGPDGEVYVNGELAAREAAARGCEASSELLFYIVHGLLHLLGYDDATPAERGRMHALQRHYLESAGVIPPN